MAVQVAVLLTVLVGFAALTIDVGAMYNAKGELQRTADAAALAAAAMLSEYEQGDPMELARQAAAAYTSQNSVWGSSLTLDPNTDVEFGRANYDPNANQYTFTPTQSSPDAVRITVRKTSDSQNGPFALMFAAVLGKSYTDISARATAIMVPRDIAIVADLSASHNDDSELRNYKLTEINLHEVWDDIPGGIDDSPDEWAGLGYAPDDPQAAGPGWGYLKLLGYGTDPITGSYDPRTDAGLVYLKKGSDWSNANLQAYLQSFQEQGYSSGEIDAIMDGYYDGSGYWDERVAVALGLARWDSGQAGGLWEKLGIDPADAGNGNNIIGSGEIVWLEAIGERTINESDDIWRSYISYMGSNSAMTSANSYFKYRFGVKTFTNYLLEKRPEHTLTPELEDTRHQPMQAVKDAVIHMAEVIAALDTDDKLSLEIYGETAKHEIDLTYDYAEVAGRLDDMQAGHYDGWTNMGGGITRGIEELTGPRARGASRKIMILLTDGQANVNEWGGTGDYYGGKAYAKAMAQAAADLGIRIFAVSVGADADTATMQEIAEIGSGQHFYASGPIEEYSEELDAIFETLGGTRPVELIE